jgi:hypothetical protein
MIDHDRLFKELISTFFPEFLELFLPQVRNYFDQGTLEFLDKEIFTDVTAGERHEVDLVAKLRFRDEDAFFLVHVENQSQSQGDFGKRMFSYFARLHEKYDLPVYPIAVLTYDSPFAAQPEVYEVKFPDRVVMAFQYRVIQLNQLNWRDFTRRENPVATALMAKMRMASDERPRVKLECMRELAVSGLNKAKQQVVLGFLDTYLGMSERDEQTYQMNLGELAPVEKEKVMELRKSWRERDREEWLQQGLEQGLEQGKQQEGQRLLSVITRQIERRLGLVDPGTRERIGQLNSDQLEQLGEVLLDFDGIEDLTRWLGTA